jgi:hypothetical protein
LACGAALVVAVLLQAGAAVATPQVSFPGGNPRNNQTVTVSGAGFPPPKVDPSGVQVLECSDPGGKIASLPTSAASCDGATVDPLPINTHQDGTFAARYTFVALNDLHGGSNINCDATHYCVLWAGVDYNNRFLGGPHAFSSAFTIGGTSTGTGGSDANVVWIPIVVVVVLVVGLIAVRRRRPRGPKTLPTARPGGAKPRVSA